MQRCVGGGAAALFTAKIISQCFMDSTFQLISDTERSITSETANWYRVAHTQYFTLYFFYNSIPRNSMSILTKQRISSFSGATLRPSQIVTFPPDLNFL
jgi:hypothetical protein